MLFQATVVGEGQWRIVCACFNDTAAPPKDQITCPTAIVVRQDFHVDGALARHWHQDGLTEPLGDDRFFTRFDELSNHRQHVSLHPYPD